MNKLHGDISEEAKYHMFRDYPKYKWKGEKKSWNLDRGVSLIAEFVPAKWGIFIRPEEILCINGCKGKHGKDLWDKSPQRSYQKYWFPSPVPTFSAIQDVQPTICNGQNPSTSIKN